MTEDRSLFGADKPAAPPNQAGAPAPIADWQVDLLRKALDARGHTTMEERQQAVESAAGREVTSLRSLSHDEGMQVLSRLGSPRSGEQGSRRSWDDREEDTWIDRL